MLFLFNQSFFSLILSIWNITFPQFGVVLEALVQLESTCHTLSQHQSPLFLVGDNFQSQILKWGDQKKNEFLGGGGLKAFLPWIFALGGLLCLLSKKKLLKLKYGFQGSISHVDIRLFQPGNQLMFSFVTFSSVKSLK